MVAAPSVAVIEDAIALACRAPSYHNSQPWRWVFGDGELRLHVDADRWVATDHSGRQALISCGAMLHHARVALAAAGIRAVIERYPDDSDHRHVATVRFAELPAPVDARLADAVLARRTDRLPLRAPEHWEPLEDVIRQEVGDGAWLDVLSDADRPALAEASDLTDALRLYDATYHAEMSWWTAPFEVSDGIPHSALVSAAEGDRVTIGRTFPVTQHRERRLDVPEDGATVVVISAVEDTRDAILACGEALSTVLLEATAAGLSTGTLTHVTELDATRDVLTALTGRALPQVLVRVGAASELDDVPPPTPRRPLGEVLGFAPAQH